MQKGLFIVIDGTDGSGKATQVKRLVKRLVGLGRKVEIADFPRYEHPSAHFLKKYLRGEYGSPESVGAKRSSIFFALDRFDASDNIRRQIEEGTIVISNRYVSANKGHQTSLIESEEERRAFVKWLNELEYGILGIPVPDLTILLHAPAEIGLRLAEERDQDGVKAGGSTDILQQIDHLKKAEEAYLGLPKLDEVEHWEVIECTEGDDLLPIETIHERVWHVVEPMLNQVSG
jgi:dTMP kinase